MDMEEKTYRRKVSSNHNSLIITIPHLLAYRMGIKKGQMMEASIDNDRLIFEHIDHNTRKNNKKTAKSKDDKKKSSEDTESKVHHVVDLDDPDFNPINRLAL